MTPATTLANEDTDAVPGDGRDETENERFDRNWNEILQELRVTQTGTQILTGFLLTLAFQQRFEKLDAFDLNLYLVLVVLSALTTGLAIAPVTLHRALFRQGAKESVVIYADHFLRATLAGVGLILSGTTLLIFDVVVGQTAGAIAGCAMLITTVVLWIILPLGARRRRRR